jgi:hypothetical protein
MKHYDFFSKKSLARKFLSAIFKVFFAIGFFALETLPQNITKIAPRRKKNPVIR